MSDIFQGIEQYVAEQATGVRGAGDYRDAALERGYPHLIVWDWTSSAGDWCFLVSTDRKRWYWFSQENNYPRPGFTYTIGHLAATFEEPTDDEDVLGMIAMLEGLLEGGDE